MEEKGIENLAENIQKNNFIRKISSQAEEHDTIYSGELELSILYFVDRASLRNFG
jgi:hypothetical protein